MKWGELFGISFVAVCIVLFHWPKIKTYQRKEKAALVALTMLGWLLACLLVFFPEMPGPGQLMEKIYKPLGKLLEK